MNALEAAKFYGNYEILFQECRLELYENVDDTSIVEEFSSCDDEHFEA